MTYDALTILIPCHSLEDFPTELGDRPAEGLLNAWAVLWHPALLAAAGVIPNWKRADDALELHPGRLVVIPSASESLVPSAWIERARREGLHVVTGISERTALVEACLAPLDNRPTVDPDLVADFLAFGHTHLQTELLTRHMRQFGNIDEEHLRRDAVEAAKAAVRGDAAAARQQLGHCFEMLLEARERFYPVECYLLDLCLVVPRHAGAPLKSLLQEDLPFNALATAADWRAITAADPELHALLRSRRAAGTLDLVGGEWTELCTPLLPLDVVADDLRRGRGAFEDLFGQRPSTWGRRRYGVSPLMPQLLKRSNYAGSLHFVMDDGIYPDEESAKLVWRGCDTSTIPSYSRIPLAGDSAAAFLRFPVRMAESMDRDHVAGLVFARWPELKSPWLQDFRRAQRYAPALGRFVTFEKFFSETNLDHRTSEFREGVYLTPFLVQAVARRESGPIHRYVASARHRTRFESAAWCRAMTDLLAGREIDFAPTEALDHALLADGPDPRPADAPAAAPIEPQLETFAHAAIQGLAQQLPDAASHSQPGLLVVNPLAFPRKVAIDWPGHLSIPAAEAPVVARQFDLEHRQIVVQTPPAGYVWIPAPPQDAPLPPPPKVPLAEEFVLRNEFLEVAISDVTGGIAQVRTYRLGGNRLSQQLAWRFPREKTITRTSPEHKTETRTTWYSEMHLRESRILCAGPGYGAFETIGELIDPTAGKPLGTYRQTYRIWRGRPLVQVDVELGLEQAPQGDPWTNYVAARFAWNDPEAALTRSLHGVAQPLKDEQRIESPQFIEFASENARTTLLTGGLPFHRLTGPRMLDTLLVVEGEAQRTFQFAVAVDQSFPLETALDWDCAPLTIPLDHGPPAAGASGWFFQISVRNVQLRRLLPLRSEHSAGQRGCLVRLQETEGRNRSFSLATCLPVAQARQIDLDGRVLHNFRVEHGAVQISIAPYELCDVELIFA